MHLQFVIFGNFAYLQTCTCIAILVFLIILKWETFNFINGNLQMCTCNL